MKKLLRATAFVLSCFLLAGCVQTPAGSSSKFTISKNDLPTVLNIYYQYAFKNSNKKTDLAALNQWNAYMTEKYGTEIKLSADLEPYQSGASVIQNGELPGMVSLPTGALTTYMETSEHESYILPLDEYLKDNKIWNALPEEFRTRFEWRGHIWAIPISMTTNLKVASINTEWLRKAGAQMPANTEQLLNTGKAFMQNDANGNGQPDDYLLDTIYSENLCSAFGLYLNGFNPKTHLFQDPKTCKEFEDLFQYVSRLYQEGLIVSGAATSNQPQISGIQSGIKQTTIADSKYKLAFAEALQEGKTEDQILASYDELAARYEALPPLGDSNVQTYTEDDSCFVMTTATKEPKQVINTFVDIMFGSAEGNLEMTYGIPDHYRKGADKVVTLIYADEANKVYPLYPGLAENLDVIDENWVIVKAEQNKELARRLKQDAKAYEKTYIDRYTKAGKLQKLTVWESIAFRNSGSMITTLMLETGEFYSTNFRTDSRFELWKSFYE